MKKIKHLLPLLLIAVLLVGMMPFNAFAQEGASADPAEATPTPAVPGDIVPSGSIPEETESPDETSPPEGTAAPTATPAPAPTAEPTPTAAPTPTPTNPPEVDPPSEDEPSIDEAHGDGIVMGPNNPPEDAPMMFSTIGNSATIAVRSCYDSSGNSINYANSFQYDGRWVGGATYPRHIIYANNSPAYCLEPGKYLVGGSNVTTDAATVCPTLSKTVREAQADTGKNDGSTDNIADGYAHTATGSDGDAMDYQIISTLPVITSAASQLTTYTFVDQLSQGITYNKGDVLIEFFRDTDCTEKIATDSYFVQANLQDGIYYVTGHTQNEDEATVFTPVNKHIIVKGLEDDTYSITETATDDGYTLLKEAVKVVISTAEGTVCDVCHKPLLTANATVNSNAADMAADGESVNALGNADV